MKIKIMDQLTQPGLDYLVDQGFTYSREEENPDGMIMRSTDIHDMDFPDSLKAIFRSGTGVNNIPVDRCSEEGIAVFNTPGANANSVKELVLGAMIVLARNVIPARDWVESLTGEDATDVMEDGKTNFRGHELRGKTLGVIGLGNVGSKVANIGVDMGMHVVGYDPYIKLKNAWEVNSQVTKLDDVQDLFRTADIITIHTPLTDETEHMIGAENLALAKDGVLVINYARKEVVDPEAMVEALESGKVDGFVHDFHDERFVPFDNVYLTPHIGGTTWEAETKSVMMAAQECVAFLKTGEITNSVNLPDMKLEFTSPYRLSIINKNVPNMVAKISTELAQLEINIDRINNAAKGDYAYTLVDISGDNLEDKLPGAMEEINADQGITRVRLIKNENF